MQIPVSLMKNAGMQYLSVPSDDRRYMKLVFTEAHRNGQPILNDTAMDFMSAEGSMTDLRTEERAALEDTPILLRAQIGSRRYKAEIFVGSLPDRSRRAILSLRALTFAKIPDVSTRSSGVDGIGSAERSSQQLMTTDDKSTHTTNSP